MDLSSDAERRLTKFFEIPEDLVPVRIHARMDRLSIAIRYRELIDQGYVKNQADLARHLGVSRAWIANIWIGNRNGSRSDDPNICCSSPIYLLLFSSLFPPNPSP